MTSRTVSLKIDYMFYKSRLGLSFLVLWDNVGTTMFITSLVLYSTMDCKFTRDSSACLKVYSNIGSKFAFLLPFLFLFYSFFLALCFVNLTYYINSLKVFLNNNKLIKLDFF